MAEPFKCLKFPESIAWLESELKKVKTIEDTELRANATCTCSLAALTCAESSRAHASRIHAACKALPPLLNTSQEELDALHAWRDGFRQDVTSWNSHIKIASDVGAKLSTWIFNKETKASSWRSLPNWRPPHHLAQQFPFTDAPLFR
jgi:hypothetical protein